MNALTNILLGGIILAGQFEEVPMYVFDISELNDLSVHHLLPAARQLRSRLHEDAKAIRTRNNISLRVMIEVSHDLSHQLSGFRYPIRIIYHVVNGQKIAVCEKRGALLYTSPSGQALGFLSARRNGEPVRHRRGDVETVIRELIADMFDELQKNALI